MLPLELGLIMAALFMVVAIPCFAQYASASQPTVLSDGADAKHKRVDNMHKTRYIEIFLAAKDPKTGKLVAACYNTMFSPEGIPATRDTAPQALVEGLDFDQMKKKYGLLSASLNGPKFWLPDWTEIEAGVLRNFNGMKAPWVAQLDMGDNTSGVSESTPYKPMHIARKSGVGWNKKGSSWVSTQRIHTKNLLPQGQPCSRSFHPVGNSGSKRWKKI